MKIFCPTKLNFGDFISFLFKILHEFTNGRPVCLSSGLQNVTGLCSSSGVHCPYFEVSTTEDLAFEK